MFSRDSVQILLLGLLRWSVSRFEAKSDHLKHSLRDQQTFWAFVQALPRKRNDGTAIDEVLGVLAGHGELARSILARVLINPVL